MSKTTLEAVEEAFADVKDDDIIIEETSVEQETPIEEPATETQETETVEETPVEEEKPADEPTEPQPEPLIAPKQVAKGFATDHWENTPREAQEEIIRLSSEN